MLTFGLLPLALTVELTIVGTADEFVSHEEAKALENEIRDAGVTVDFEYYEGAGHAFFNDHNRLGTYDPAQADLSWERTVSFLRDALA